MILIAGTTSTGTLSRLIRWVTRSDVSHVCVVDTAGIYGRSLVLEAHEDGFRAVTLSTFLQQNKLIRCYVPATDLSLSVHLLVDSLGRPYDFGGLVGCLWVLLGRAFNRTWANPWQDQRAFFCSEALTDFLKKLGHPGFEKAIPSSTTPEDLCTLLDRWATRVEFPCPEA